MKLNRKKNDVELNGYVANVSMRNGENGPFGSVTIGVDDSYRGKDGFVERSQMIRVELSGDIAGLAVGDFVEFEGRLIYEQSGSDGNSRLKVKGKIVGVMPKACINALKQAGLYGNQQSQQSGQQGGGYAPQQNNHQHYASGQPQQSSHQQPSMPAQQPQRMRQGQPQRMNGGQQQHHDTAYNNGYSQWQGDH